MEEQANLDTVALVDKLGPDSGASAEELDQVKAVVKKTDSVEIPAALMGADSEKEVTDIRLLINDMKLPQKVKLAMFGNKTARGLLIGDRNKMVQMFVLKNPRLQPQEVESFASSPNTSDHVLREIANNRDWMKDYNMKLVIVKNPKAPADISLKLLRFLHANDIKTLSRAKNIPQVVSVSARKRLADLEKRK